MKNNRYWEDRVNQLLADNQANVTPDLLRINKAYEKALKDIQHDINQIFLKYAAGHNLTVTQAKRLLNSKIDNFIHPIIRRIYPRLKEGKLKDWCLAELNANAYRARITRLEALKKSIQLHCLEVYEQELKLSTRSYIKTIKEAYYRTCYDFQKGINLAFDVASINQRAVDMLLKNEWLGRNYSTSVWNNTQTLASKLDETITRGFISGKSLKEIAKDLEYLSELGMFAAERLLRTETSYFSNQAALQGYKEVGIEKYVYVATLDKRTCSCGKHGKKSCGELDGKVFEIAKQQVGVNMSPLHPMCRCCCRAYINQEILDKAKRRARNPETGKTYLVDNMSYKEWKEKYIS